MGTSPIGGNGPTQGQQIYKVDELAYGISNGYAPASINGQKFIPTSIPMQAGGDLKEYKDNTGVTCSIVIPEAFQTISISGLLIKNSSSPIIKKGDKIDGLPPIQGMLSNVTWRVQDYSVTWQNEDVAQVSCSVKAYTF